MKKRILLIGGLLSLIPSFFSCSEELLESSQSEYVNRITVSMPCSEAVDETSTRAVDIDGNQMTFSWSAGDVIGVYPLRDAVSGNSMGEDQHAFPISSGAGTTYANFDGGAWALRSNILYSAYYPFSSGNYQVSPTAIPISYIGQAQDGNASSSHLGSYDFLAAPATQPSASGSVNLQMGRLGCFVELQLTMPVADNFTQVSITSDKTEFVTAGTVDLTAATPSITPTTTSPTVKVDLTNIATTSNEQKLIIFFMTGIADLSDSHLTITVKGTTYQTYVTEVNGKNLTVNGWKRFKSRCGSGTDANGNPVTFGEALPNNTHAYVDLGITSNGHTVCWATCNVGADSPEDYGKYYAWGETKARGEEDTSNTANYQNQGTYTKTYYSWGTYKYGLHDALTKYNTFSNYGEVDNLTTLSFDDDAARTEWGSTWRIPTAEEITLLSSQCYWQWVTSYNGKDVCGYVIFKAKSDADKGKKSTDYLELTSTYSVASDSHIFLPAAGESYYNGFQWSEGKYWSNSLVSDYPIYAYSINFSTNSVSCGALGNRFLGFSIRPVADNCVFVSNITLNRTTLTVGVNQEKTLVATVAPTNATTPTIQWTSSNEAIATVSADGVVKGVSAGSVTITAAASDGSGVSATCELTVVQHEYVDLGITSNGKTLYWATCNVGAENPEDYGYYFAWGATTGCDNTKGGCSAHIFNWQNAPFNGGKSDFNKTAWTSAKSTAVNGNNVLLPANDAATANWDGAWRMPTYAEQTQLCTECYWQWVTIYNGKSVNGYVVYKAKAAADKGKYSFDNPTLSASYSVTSDTHIFLPAAGYRNGTSLVNGGSSGEYWSSSLYESFPNSGRQLYFGSRTVEVASSYRKCGGCVRPVCVSSE